MKNKFELIPYYPELFRFSLNLQSNSSTLPLDFGISQKPFPTYTNYNQASSIQP